ncbi:MAG TPA: DUF2071 domain-containing protein [Thermoanaerobaculia bacterium]|nr:DUF2071 domain-containing protein [Thermoanaerobaculia bacterium]
MAGPAPSFLTAEWRFLAMLNWEMDRALLRPLVPAGTELDEWNGRVYASVVGFLFRRTRVLGIPALFHGEFEEVNLRFYVRRRTADGFRRGVVFVKELVPRRLVALIARRAYHEKYVAVPMAHEIALRPDGSPERVAYSWSHAGAAGCIRLAARPGLRPLAAGSVEEFLAEHYFGYVEQPRGATAEYEVEHPPWKTWAADEARLEGGVASLYGAAFASALGGPPDVAFLAEGSEIRVRRGTEIDA